MTKRFPGMTIIYTSIQIVEQIDWRKLVHQRSSPKARMTKLIVSDELQLERRNLHLVFHQRDVPY